MNDNYPEEEDFKLLNDCMKHKVFKEAAEIIASLFNETNTGKGCVYQDADTGKNVLRLTTGGWSGCEDMIAEMNDNTIWWSLYWASSTRGGLYLFDDSNVSKEFIIGELNYLCLKAEDSCFDEV